MKRSKGRRRYREPSSEGFQAINITPFTDVLLVLLIIFLIAGSSLAPTGLEVDELASGVAPGPASATVEEGTLRVEAGGGLLYLRGERRVVEPKLEELPREEPLNLTAPASTPVESVVTVYDRLLRLGFTRVRLAPPADL